MRALLGGLIGAAASAAGWLAVEHFQQASYGWMVVLVGLVTGFCVHKAGEGNSGGFARGALAIILTLAAIVGGRQVYAKIMQASSTAASAVTVDTAKVEVPDADEEEADTGEAPAPVVTPELAEDAGALGKRGYSKTAMKKNLSEMDMVWMCVAALASYVIGKGGDEPAPGEEGEQGEGQPEQSEGGDQPQEEMPENEAE